jgi:hypothetical protein
MDTIQTTIQDMNQVPHEFWYACTMILTAILIWVIQRYFSSLQNTIKDLSESVKDLTKLVILHDEQIKQLQNRGLPKRRGT